MSHELKQMNSPSSAGETFQWGQERFKGFLAHFMSASQLYTAASLRESVPDCISFGSSKTFLCILTSSLFLFWPHPTSNLTTTDWLEVEEREKQERKLWKGWMCRPKRGVQVQMREERNCNFKLYSFDLTFNYKVKHCFRKNWLYYLRMPGKTISIFPEFLSGAEEELAPQNEPRLRALVKTLVLWLHPTSSTCSHFQRGSFNIFIFSKHSWFFILKNVGCQLGDHTRILSTIISIH